MDGEIASTPILENIGVEKAKDLDSALWTCSLPRRHVHMLARWPRSPSSEASGLQMIVRWDRASVWSCLNMPRRRHKAKLAGR
mmetsp:Transcript_28863/g.61434  ORF Transcript_28863/g.61434 Transcript_28863/m.61434 type:complete len:83 (-) Transcript_28863:13-261(-)